MKEWPLRWRLTSWSALVTGAALLTFGVAGVIGLYWREVHDLDERLEAQAKLFFREVRAKDALSPTEVERVAALLKASGDLRGFAFGPASGRPEFVSSEKIAPLTEGWPPSRRGATVWHDRRFVRIAVATKDGRTLALFASQKPAHEMIAEVAGAYLLALPVVLLVVGAGSWWFARRALQPIVALTREAAAITATRLDTRLPAPPVDDEIGRHVRVLNAMFDRLQASFEQATRFTADASHELRTPLTILRGEIESALQAPDAGAPEKLLVNLLEQTVRLQKITDDLLLLSRFDAGKLPLALGRVNFSATVREALEDAGMLAAPLGLSIEHEVADGIFVQADASLLRRVLLNLVDNAVRYNRAGGAIRFGLGRDAASAVLRIRNTGPGIPDDRRAGVFQRFFRANNDRNSATGGNGLGLSLCREIVTAHGGSIALVASVPDCTEFEVRLPVPDV